MVTQGFSQISGVDYEGTYSSVIDRITFRFLIAIAANNKLNMQLMDVVIAYLYGLLEKNIYMKISKGYKIIDNTKQRHLYSIKLQRSLYGLKQSGRMWYNRLSDYLIKK